MTFLMIMAVLCPNGVLATSWWGIGVRSDKWILNHGGTIIRFDIEDHSGSRKEYKAVMYDEKGKYVEAEWGIQGMFDDAKDGVYTIKAKRGEEADFGVKDSREEGKTFAKIKFTAHPGETIKIKFNYKKKSAKMTTDYVAPVAKVPAKPVPVVQPEQPAIENTQEDLEPFPSAPNFPPNEEANFFYKEVDPFCKNEKNEFLEYAEDFVHPDVLAKESEQSISKSNAEDLSNNSEKNNFLEKLIQAISSWLRSVI